MTGAAETTTLDSPRVDLTRGALAIEIGVTVELLSTAHFFLGLSYDKEAVITLDKAKARMRSALLLSSKLMQEVEDAEITGQAAVEFREQRSGARA